MKCEPALEYVYNPATEIYDINRVKRPKMRAYGSGANSTVALAYYDYNHTKNPVRFRYGTAYKNNKGNFKSSGGFESNAVDIDTEDNSSAANCHIVASSETTYKSGEFTATALANKIGGTGYVGLVAWYDAQNRKPMFSYNEAPETAVTGGVWQTNALVLDEAYNGWHIDMDVDSSGGIHIAYYNSKSGDLKYAYLENYKDKTPEVVIVDSYLSVGTNITVNAKGTTPYISYFNASANQTSNTIRIAWKVDTSGVLAGAVNDLYTKAWEVIPIPTTNIPVDATVCHGLPKDSHTTYKGSPVLGYMSDGGYEKAYIKY